GEGQASQLSLRVPQLIEVPPIPVKAGATTVNEGPSTAQFDHKWGISLCATRLIALFFSL
ncbi:MAG: hypothetical protein WBJ33_03845, partial [Candidatus Nanopelagicales bacterium]